MSEQNRYRLSFHISHPNLSSEGIVDKISFPIRYSRSFGDIRRAPGGRELGGRYVRTDISFDVSGGVLINDEKEFSECLRCSMGKVPLDLVGDIVRTGGECFYLAGVYSESNFLIYMDRDILLMLSSALVGMKFDFYGGAEEGSSQ